MKNFLMTLILVIMSTTVFSQETIVPPKGAYYACSNVDEPEDFVFLSKLNAKPVRFWVPLNSWYTVTPLELAISNLRVERSPHTATFKTSTSFTNYKVNLKGQGHGDGYSINLTMKDLDGGFVDTFNCQVLGDL